MWGAISRLFVRIDDNQKASLADTVLQGTLDMDKNVTLQQQDLDTIETKQVSSQITKLWITFDHLV